MKNSEKPAYAFSYNPNEDHGESGLTKREYFAGLMMKHFVDAGWTDYVTAAKNSINAADALLKQLEA